MNDTFTNNLKLKDKLPVRASKVINEPYNYFQVTFEPDSNGGAIITINNRFTSLIHKISFDDVYNGLSVFRSLKTVKSLKEVSQA